MFTLLKGFSSKKINKNVIQHIHLPKCGGTTIDHIFQKYSLIDPTVKFFRFKQNRRELEIKNLNKNFEKNNIFFVSGHIQENFLKDLQTNNIFKFSIIRNPIERFFSHYKFYLYKKNINPDNFSIDEYIKNETLLKRDNILARTFANKIEKDIEVNTNIKT